MWSQSRSRSTCWRSPPSVVATRSDRMSATQVRLIRLGLIVLMLALWELYARFVSTSSLVAGPSDVALAWWPKVLGEPGVRIAVLVTLVELVVAFALSVVFGMLIGILVGLSDIGRRSVYPA